MTGGVTAAGRLTGEQVSEVTAVVGAATATDGVRPLSEAASLRLRDGQDVRHLLSYDDGRLVGYGQVDTGDPRGASAELVVAPAARRRGFGRRLAEAAHAESPDGRLRAWAHGDLPGAAELAALLGYVKVRELWRMERALTTADAPALPEPRLPDGVRVRPFVPGRDEEAWLAVNGRAFDHHPEQGRTTRADLEEREHEGWFDPAGFFLAERDGRLLGFHWTKVVDPGAGEVYVIGVDPRAQGGGLGKALVLVGLHHLRERGLPRAELYVEADNAPAVAMYERLGFAHLASDVMYASGLSVPR